METIGHHCCKRDGGFEYVTQNAPFPAEYIEDDESSNYPFLGSGYYYWDDNLSMAKWWGETHYKQGYFIVESQLNLQNGIFLDLVGNRAHQKWFMSMIDILKEFGYNREEWTIGSIIEYAKMLKNRIGDNKIFPYLVIRAIDIRQNKKQKILLTFAPDMPNDMNFNPKMIICLIEKREEILKTVKIVHASTQ